mmetsp:Transcript_125405/g.220853  ORF Transcript_125405/g.220853 Transcript_125405/m.220853 type:complete len:654 (-) Transcript_125405:149-2110(-)
MRRAMPKPWRISLVMLMLPRVCEALMSGKPGAKRPKIADMPAAAEQMPAAHAAATAAHFPYRQVDAEKHAARQPSIVEVPGAQKTAAAAESPDTAHGAFHQFQLFLQWQQQAKDFAEFMQHRTQFFAWRQSSVRQSDRQPKNSHEQEPSKAEKLFPVARHGGKALLSYIVTSDQGDALPLEQQSSSTGSFAEINSQVEETAYNQSTRDVNVLRFLDPENTANLTEVNQTQGLVAGILSAPGTGDWFLISGVLLFIAIYCISGFWGLLDYLIFQVEHGFSILYHLWEGTPIPHPGNHFHKLALEEGKTVEEHGIARPGAILFKTEWRNLTPGQRHVFELAHLDEKSWDETVRKCVENPGLTFCEEVGMAWDDLRRFERGLLKQIGVSRQIWNQEDPSNFPIRFKTWNDLSEFEHFTAVELGVHGDQNADEWNRRDSPIFHTRWRYMTPDQQSKLRKIGFRRENWKCYFDPVPPTLVSSIENRVAQFWHSMYTNTVHWLLIFWTLMNCLWLLVVLWRLKVFQSLVHQYDIYLLIAGAAIGIAILLWKTLRPVVTYHGEHLVSEVRICIGHVKDTWRLASVISRRFQHLHTHCKQRSILCAQGGCICCPICGAVDACRGQPESQERRETSCFECLPCLCGGSAHRESLAAAAAGQT